MTDQAGQYLVVRHEPSPSSVADVRRRVEGALDAWGEGRLGEDAVLCATELVTNAILHSRGPYDLVIRPIAQAIRIDVMDARPEELPAPVPTDGSASDIVRASTTGRGLLIVASLAARWGVTVAAGVKSVWAELTGTAPRHPTDPEVVLDSFTAPNPDAYRLYFTSLPVRSAVRSGFQVDDLVREIQLESDQDIVDDDERRLLYSLLDRSAHLRYSGRYAALRAASASKLRFNLDLVTPIDGVHALEDLSGMLSSFPRRWRVSAAVVDETVGRFRAWLSEETARQLRGESPRQCPLPD